RHRKPGFKDEAIDIHELASMPNLDGMLSFLERTPAEYAQLFHKDQDATSLPQSPSSEVVPGSGNHAIVSTPVNTSMVAAPLVETIQSIENKLVDIVSTPVNTGRWHPGPTGDTAVETSGIDTAPAGITPVIPTPVNTSPVENKPPVRTPVE